MDKRTLLAAALMALVIVVTPRLFSSRSAPPPSVDSATNRAIDQRGDISGTSDESPGSRGGRRCDADHAASDVLAHESWRGTRPRDHSLVSRPPAG